ncbi:MAP-homologous protein 1 [Pseudozyma hubeiensis]|nr:MAP-homologous protein 1 [Pseudozyma hubeiensis]
MSESNAPEHDNQPSTASDVSASTQDVDGNQHQQTEPAALDAVPLSQPALSSSDDVESVPPAQPAPSPVIPGAFNPAALSASASSPIASTSGLSNTTDKPLPIITDQNVANAASALDQQRQFGVAGPSSPKAELESSMITAVSPVRRSIYKRKLGSKPKGILKPAPPPQKGFSFRRDIIQNINTRLAQQGVNVQVPVPQSGTAQATASYIGGMFRKIGGIAAGAAANVSGSSATTVGGFLNNDQQTSSNGSAPHSSTSHVDSNVNRSSTSTTASSSGSTAVTSQQNDSDNGSTSSLVKSTVVSSTTSAAPLKKVQFQVSHMTVTYPIVGAGTPEDEDLTRLRIEREHRRMLKARRGRPWTPEQLETLYRECCRTREEHPLKKMRLVFQEAAQATPPALKTMDLSFVPLDRHAVEPIADLLSVDFGLNKLVLENCALTDDTVKSILHALLVSGTLPNLSIASNRKIRFRGWKYVAIFMRRARALRYLDLSENSIDRLSLEHILAVITKPPSAVTNGRMPPASNAKADTNGTWQSKAETGAEADDAVGDGEDDGSDDEFFDDSGKPLMPTAPLLRDVSDDPDPPTSAIISLRLENCGLKAASLEMLSQAVRFSDIRHLSLRRNKIGQLASVALAIMLKDYPDSVFASESQASGTQERDAKSYFESAAAASSASGAAAADASDRSGRTFRAGDALTTPERRQRSYSPGLPDVPVIVSSPGGGITSRRMPGHVNGGSDQRPTTFYGAHTEQLQDAMQTSIAGPTAELDLSLTPQQRLDIRRNSAPNLSEEEAVAIYQAKRARRILADLPRVGNLLTLDLKSNDIRGGVVYLAQVLKKNRTLRVLNLSDNNIEMPGLVAVAEALKYNSTLETLDMSHNPCSGPGLEGITTLRTAFALNSQLKRLFLNDTDLSSEAAIALAEFLPEAKSLIHLDLAENFSIDIAGVMALAVSLRMNRSLRCLDLNIPANNPDFARLSQEILQSCVRNTEAAQQRAERKGLKQKVAAPIYRSVVARAVRENEERERKEEMEREGEVRKVKERERAEVEALVGRARDCVGLMKEVVQGEGKGEVVEELKKQGEKLRKKLVEVARRVEEGDLLEKVLMVHDELEEVGASLERIHAKDGPVTKSLQGEAGNPMHLSTPDPEVASGLNSPAFSIADSDEESDDDSSNQRKARSSLSGDAAPSSQAAPLSEAMLGLRIQTSQLEPLSAAREEPPPDPHPPRSPTENLAKGQLSEEGELFRKARSLGLDGRDSDDEAPAEEQPVENESGSSPTAASASPGQQGADTTASASEGVAVDTLQAAVHDSELTGEQLRKDLLKVDVPPKSDAPTTP